MLPRTTTFLRTRTPSRSLLSTIAVSAPPASTPSPVSKSVLQSFQDLSTQSVIDGLWVMGWPCGQIGSIKPLPGSPSQKMVGRAVTLGFMPTRPDIVASKAKGGDSPEYVAFELCGPEEVLVMGSVGPDESVGGDIKFLRLMQRNIGGLVTDGSVRDTDEILGYGFPTYCVSSTAKQGPQTMQPWECNGVLNVGGVVVRPGDIIVGDQDGVVVVPAAVATTVEKIARGREEIEVIVKEELTKNPGPPGKFYPFLSGTIKPDSPLGRLLSTKGITEDNSNQFEGKKDW
ncbi:hypothetical protein ScalyP_jg5245 [Parmales sp. scaly parma]|nr:hypothetical protein ScalyP_jg5245 [Parmales sp. scaly parma]